MTKQELAFLICIGEEGGYSNDPNDPGGETNWGICKRDHPDLDIKNLTKEQALAIYDRKYWTPDHCGDLPAPLAVCVFDCALNQGAETAVRLLQSVLLVDVDGKVGPKTLAKIRLQNPLWLLARFMSERMFRYMGTKGFDNPDTPDNHHDGIYARNWTRRTYEVMARAWAEGGQLG